MFEILRCAQDDTYYAWGDTKSGQDDFNNAQGWQPEVKAAAAW